MKHMFDKMTSDFKCKHCKQYVSTDPLLSGVNNRNHCPYCLYSRHLDLHEAGDRLAACKEKMQPVGLTLKKTRKKYGPERGEMMLIHQCVDCGAISINRTAADDDAETILAIFERSQHLDPEIRARIAKEGVQPLSAADARTVRQQLFGLHAEPRPRPAEAVYW